MTQQRQDGWGTWPARIVMLIVVGGMVWGAAVVAVNARATADTLANIVPRVEAVEDWQKERDLRRTIEAELRAEIEAECAEARP